jgi:hypothetical protein
MINFKCFECNEELEVPQSMIGEQVKCPGCGRNETVPNPDLKQAGGDELGTDDDPIAIDVDFGVDPEDLAAPSEDQLEKLRQEAGPRRVLINSEGEVIMTANSKSVLCPIREKRCTCTCAWFSIDHELRQATCQDKIQIGEIEKNEYGKDSKDANHW